MRETDPRTILRDLLPETALPPDLDDMTLWQIIINISEPPKRRKRKDINTLEDVLRLLHESKKILVLTGAGVSNDTFTPPNRSTVSNLKITLRISHVTLTKCEIVFSH